MMKLEKEEIQMTLQDFTVNLSLEVAEKLQKVSEDKGEKEISTATSFIVKGVTDAYKDLE